MQLLIDLGNTRLKLALVDGKRHLSLHTLVHADADFLAQLEHWIANTELPAQGWLASVAGTALTEAVCDAFMRHGHALRRITPQAGALGLEVGYAHVAQLGVDRWLALLALHLEAQAPCLSVSVGSALTCDALDADGRHWGGLIAPTPEAMRAALLARAPQLPAAQGAVHTFASSTQDGIESGCTLAAVSLIEHCRNQMAQRLDQPVQLILSGGGASALQPLLSPHAYRPNLVLDGMAHWVARA